MPLPGSPRRRLPTVEIYHKKTGKTRIVNATVYATDYLCDLDWTTQHPKVSGYREGTMDKAEVLEDKREFDLNQFRLNDPHEAKKRGDRKRAFEEGSMVAHNIVTEEGVDPDWRKMPWFKKRVYIKELTGVSPKNKVHAEELMKEK